MDIQIITKIQTDSATYSIIDIENGRIYCQKSFEGIEANYVGVFGICKAIVLFKGKQRILTNNIEQLELFYNLKYKSESLQDFEISNENLAIAINRAKAYEMQYEDIAFRPFPLGFALTQKDFNTFLACLRALRNLEITRLLKPILGVHTMKEYQELWEKLETQLTGMKQTNQACSKNKTNSINSQSTD